MLRVGVALDSMETSAWIASAVERIQASSFARIELVLLGGTATEDRGGFLFRAYEAWDYKRYTWEQDALRRVSVAGALGGVPVAQWAERPDAGPPPGVRDLDVLVDFGAEEPVGPAWPEGPRLGTLRVQSELDFPGWKGRSGALATLQRTGTCASWVRLTGARGQDRVLVESAASFDGTSLYRSRNPLLWKNVELLMRAMERLAKAGPHGRAAAGEESYRRPTNLATAAHLARYARRWAREKFAGRAGRPGHRWHIAVRTRSEGRGFDDPEGYRLMPCAEDRFYADPFLFEWRGRTFLFFEDFRYADGRALISCCELDESGIPGEPFEVLRRPYHLSYPSVFEDGGEIYMVPESRSNRTVELYRATDFPRAWQPEQPVMKDVDAVDATIVRRDGRYWMFAGMSDGRFSNSDELSLFMADRLRGPWRAHPRNPLVSDVRRARSAGWLFDDGGRLIRPSQDCSLAYGYALVFSEVVKMTETEYEERVISRIEPGAFAGVANHTYNRTARFEVVDRDLPVR